MAWGFEFQRRQLSQINSDRSGIQHRMFFPIESVTSPQGRFQAVNESLCSSDNQAFKSETFQFAAPSGSSIFDQALPSG